MFKIVVTESFQAKNLQLQTFTLLHSEKTEKIEKDFVLTAH